MSVAISVAMATYNGAAYLDAQLDSLATQTALPAELVVTDDGSTDTTLDILAAFAARAPFPVRVERNPARLGYADNFLKAAALCRAPYIAFCDQDDVWLPGKLAHVTMLIERHHPAMVVHAGTTTDAHLAPIGLTIPPIHRFAVSNNLFRPIPNGCAMVFARALLDGVETADRFPSSDGKGAASHDEFVYVLALARGPIVYSPEKLMLYRRHGQTATVFDPEILRAPGADRGTRIGAEEFAQMRRILATRQSFLRHVAPVLSSVAGEAAARAIGVYAEAIAAIDSRAAIHAGAIPRIRRLALLARLLGRGAYRANCDFGFSWRSFAKDAVCAVIGRPHV